MTEYAFLSLGSNLGNRQEYLSGARALLGASEDFDVVAHSTIEETLSLGDPTDPPFLNQMILGRSDVAPVDLLALCHEAEHRAGRVRDKPWGPRTLDVDIVRYGDLSLDQGGLIIPHPQIRHRPFWIREIAELFLHTVGAEDPQLPAWAHVKDSRREHIERVVALVAAWAIAMDQPPEERRRWLRAAFLHDALRDADLTTLRDLAGVVDGSRGLTHGPAAAAYAAQMGEADDEVLEAVRFHTVGHPSWGWVGKMLYMADFLEPGRSFKPKKRAQLAAKVPVDPEGVFQEVVEWRLRWSRESGFALGPESQELWNTLIRS